MKTLVFWAAGSAAQARARAAAGAQILLWAAPGEAALRAAGVPFQRVSDLVGEDDRDAADRAAIDWTKHFGKQPLQDGVSLRERLPWKGVSLWWLAELYLHHSCRGPALVRTVETLFRLLERTRPEEVEAAGLGRVDALLLVRVCTALRILCEGPRAGSRLAAALARTRVSLASRWNTAKTVLGSLKARGHVPPAPPDDPTLATVLFLSHAAFWRERGEDGKRQAFEHYFDRLIPGVAAQPGLRPFVVAVGPRAPFRRRGAGARWREWLATRPGPDPYVHVNRYTSAGVVGEVWKATRWLRREWRLLRRLPALQQAFSHRGVGFQDLAPADLAGVMLLQLPWAVLAYEQAREALRRVRPALLCLYAESSGWGRAAIAAAEAEGVPSLALQHGILYPSYFSYLHPPDEADCPRPRRTAVFGAAARRFLVEDGGYAPETLVLTGSPKFDELLQRAAQWDRPRLREALGVGEGDTLLVLASRFHPIRETHHAAGEALPALVRAVDALEGAHCLIKPHPAEPAEPYERVLREAGALRTRVLPPRAELLELLHAADVLVTVESLSAVEALVLGRPVVVLETPNHLRDLVQAGVAVGVAKGSDPAGALWSVLFDPEAREQLDRARQRYLGELALGVDGRAAERILELVRGMARPATEGGAVTGTDPART